MKKVFIYFLKYHGAYDAYMSNLEYVFSSVFTLSKDEWLHGSFLWSSTTEGLDYWSDLAKKWEKLIKAMQCKR